jgi:predicted ArsR family transcriptional regulator
MTTPLSRLSRPAEKVLAQLRGAPKTVKELAKALHLTPNAIRNQLRDLETAGLATRSGTRSGRSKPSLLYSITVAGETQFSTVYLPVLSEFLRIAETRCSPRQIKSLMSETGKSLGSKYEKPRGTRKERVMAAARLLRGLGGVAEVRTRNGSVMIRSAGCPLALLTADQPAACGVLESLLGEFVGSSVRSCCRPGEVPNCCFEIS